MVEPVLLPEQSQVNEFLPPNNYPLPLDPRHPVTMGDFAPPVVYSEIKWAQEINLEKSKEVILEVWKKFGDQFGRYYNPIECYRCEECDTLLMTMGSYSETAMTAIDQMKEAGKKVGLIHIRLWRPFPYEDLRQAVKNVKNLIVLDRAISFGQSGPVASEIKSALYHQSRRPKVVGFVGGLGGRDISPADFIAIVDRGIEIARTGSKREFEIFGVRE